jgi:phage/plasmid-associated DNA primase
MWMFEGWRRYQARGHQLDVPEAVRAATQVYRRQCDSVERWIDIWCDRGFGKEFREKAEDLRQHYNKWANNNPGVVMLGKQEFKNLLEEKNFRYVKSTASFEGLKIRATAVSLESDGDGG